MAATSWPCRWASCSTPRSWRASAEPLADDEQAALAYLRQHHDKRYSAVDCLSFVVMLAHGIDTALTLDRRDFSHRFRVLPGPILAAHKPRLQ